MSYGLILLNLQSTLINWDNNKVVYVMKRILVALVFCIFSLNMVMATIVESTPTKVNQSDGTVLTVIPYGDERCSWYRTIDGYTLMISKNHDFVYAITDGQGGIRCSNIIAHNPNDRTVEEEQFIASLQKKLFYSKEQVVLMKQYIDAGVDYSKKIAKLKAGGSDVEDYKMIVILMSFKDYPFSTSKQDVDDLFNQIGYSKNGHPGSVHDFFVASSSGKLNLSATVVGPYVSDSVQEYYGKQEGNIKDLHVRELIKEAVKKADEEVDFSEYTNGDINQYVSCVYVLYAGYAQSSNINYPDLIWPHRSILYPSMTVDNVKIRDYGCSSELSGYVGGEQPIMIGTICHEFSHVLGQPDYYDTDYELHGNAFNPGTWDLMAGGNYNGNGAFPPTWHAMERSVRNYVTIEDGQLNKDYTLEELSSSAKSICLRYDGLPNEYFLLENRQQSGFDYYLEGHGLIIYKVDKNVQGWNNNCVNCDTTRLGFELVTANGGKHEYKPWLGGYSYGEEQPFPGSTNNHSFTDNTDPSSKSYNQYPLNKPVFRIMENTTTKNITFHVGDTTNFVNIYDANTDVQYNKIVSKASFNSNGIVVTEKGFLYSKLSLPTEIDATKQVDNSPSTNNISVDITGLESNQIYYLRPYVKSATVTSYGEIMQVRTPCTSVEDFPYENDFSNGIEACWTEENNVYICNNWKVSEDKYVYIKNNFGWDNYSALPQPLIKLITPPMNVTVLDKPMVKFSHKQKTLLSKTDHLRVYYKISLNANWILLKEYTNPISNWEMDSIELPVKSKTMYIGFEAFLNSGDGVYLDSVVVTDKKISSWPQVTFTTIEDITDESVLFKANVISTGFTPLTDKGFVLSMQPQPTINDTIISVNNFTIGAYELMKAELEPSTQYYVRAFARNQGLISYSSEKSFTTQCPRIKDFPYSPNLSSEDTICFDRQGKLILPILDLSYKESMEIIYTATKNILDDEVKSIKVYYRNGVNGTWELLNTSANQQNISLTVSIPTQGHQNAMSYIAFEGAGLNDGDYLLSTITVKAVSQIPFVSTDSISLQDYNKIYVEGEISYEGLSTVTQRGFVYSKTKNPTIVNDKISVGNGIGQFNAIIPNLEPLTTYYVRAYATNTYGTKYGQNLKITTPYIPIFNNVISANQHLCAGSVPATLSGSMPTGGNGEYEYLWISSTDAIKWDSCNEGTTNTNVWYEPRQLFKTTYYRRVVKSYVSIDTSDIVKITIDPMSKGGNVFAMQSQVNKNEDAKFQLRAYVGQIMFWERLRPGYDWVKIDSTADMEYFTDRPEDVGEYVYRATVKSGVCKSAVSGEDKVNVLDGVGLNKINTDLNLKLLPNPTSGIIILQFNNELVSKNMNIVVSDAKGNKVYNESFVLVQKDKQIDLENLPNGVYIITISGKNIYKNIKLIISK